MTVSTQTAKSQYTGNGVTTAFTGSFPILDEDHALVILTSTLGVDTTQTISTHYTISGVGGATFTVTFLTAPASGVKVTIARNVPLTQELDLVENDEMPSAELEKSYDKAVMIDQQTNEKVTRALTFPVTDSSSLSAQLPGSVARAGKLLRFNSTTSEPEVVAIGDLGATELPLSVSNGGTGASTATAARTALGLGTAAVLDVGTSATNIVQLDGSARLPAVDGSQLTGIAGGTATITAGENLADRDVIYQDVFNQRSGGADRWYKVDTNATGPVYISPRIGIALAAITSGDTGSAQVRAGRVSGFTSLTAGQQVFASTTAGGVTQTAPATPSSGTQIATRCIGVAASATEIDFEPAGETIFTARNSSVAVDGTITVQHWTDTGAREREQGAYLVQAAATSAVSGATGSNIGNFTSNGGLAAAFDGTTSQALASSAARAGSVTDGYVGKTYSPAKAVHSVVVYGTNDAGYVNGANPNITLVLRGKNGSAPSSRTDGTSLGSVTFADTANESGNPRTITSSDLATAWDHVFIDFSQDGAAAGCYIAELTVTESLGAARDEPLTIGGSVANSSATDRVNVRYDDGSGADADTRTTFINRTGATRDLAVEVSL